MSMEDEDDLLILLEHNFVLVEKVRALTDRNALLMEVIQGQDGLDKEGIRTGAIRVPGLEGRA